MERPQRAEKGARTATLEVQAGRQLHEDRAKLVPQAADVIEELREQGGRRCEGGLMRNRAGKLHCETKTGWDAVPPTLERFGQVSTIECRVDFGGTQHARIPLQAGAVSFDQASVLARYTPTSSRHKYHLFDDAKPVRASARGETSHAREVDPSLLR
jgi:hypothetical protein